MKILRYFLLLCAIIFVKPTIANNSIRLRLEYNDPVELSQCYLGKKNTITIESNLNTDEYFYIAILKKVLGKVYIEAVSDRRTIYGWLELKKGQLYVMLKSTEAVRIKLYRRPCADEKYLVKEGDGEFDLYPVVDVNIRTGWVSVRYEDGKCYWVSPEVQCPWYTECYGS